MKLQDFMIILFQTCGFNDGFNDVLSKYSSYTKIKIKGGKETKI